MVGNFGNRRTEPKEFGERTLKAGRMLHMCQESGTEDPWNTVAMAVCAFEGLHTKDGWEYLLMNRRDIEDIAGVFDRSSNPEEFAKELLRLKERDLARRAEARGGRWRRSGTVGRVAAREESKAEVRGALARLGWEVRAEDPSSGAVIGGHGKYYLMVSFGEEGPTSVIISYVGGGGGLLSRAWPGVERLPTPRNVVRALSRAP